MLLIDKYAYFNQLKDIHPVEKMIFALFLLLFGLIVKDTLTSLITFIVMSAFIIFGAKIPITYYVKLLLLPSFFLLTGLVSILISFANQHDIIPATVWSISVGIWKIFISETSVHTAIQLAFTVIGSMSCLYFLILTTPIHSMLHILQKLKVPSLLIELIEITYRFIFIFLESALNIYQAQNSRLGYMTVKQSIHSISLLVASLFTEIFKRAKDITVAMNARGYSGEIHYMELSFRHSVKYLSMFSTVSILIIILYIFFGGIIL